MREPFQRTGEFVSTVRGDVGYIMVNSAFDYRGNFLHRHLGENRRVDLSPEVKDAIEEIAHKLSRILAGVLSYKAMGDPRSAAKMRSYLHAKLEKTAKVGDITIEPRSINVRGEEVIL